MDYDYALRIIWEAVEYLSNLENQDHTLVMDMSQAMIWDLRQTGMIQALYIYVRQYCDVADGPWDIQRFVDEIMQEVER
jgi:hypothetical protein